MQGLSKNFAQLETTANGFLGEPNMLTSTLPPTSVIDTSHENTTSPSRKLPATKETTSSRYSSSEDADNTSQSSLYLDDNIDIQDSSSGYSDESNCEESESFSADELAELLQQVGTSSGEDTSLDSLSSSVDDRVDQRVSPEDSMTSRQYLHPSSNLVKPAAVSTIQKSTTPKPYNINTDNEQESMSDNLRQAHYIFHEKNCGPHPTSSIMATYNLRSTQRNQACGLPITARLQSNVRSGSLSPKEYTVFEAHNTDVTQVPIGSDPKMITLSPGDMTSAVNLRLPEGRQQGNTVHGFTPSGLMEPSSVRPITTYPLSLFTATPVARQSSHPAGRQANTIVGSLRPHTFGEMKAGSASVIPTMEELVWRLTSPTSPSAHPSGNSSSPQSCGFRLVKSTQSLVNAKKTSSKPLIVISDSSESDEEEEEEEEKVEKKKKKSSRRPTLKKPQRKLPPKTRAVSSRPTKKKTQLRKTTAPRRGKKTKAQEPLFDDEPVAKRTKTRYTTPSDGNQEDIKSPFSSFELDNRVTSTELYRNSFMRSAKLYRPGNAITSQVTACAVIRNVVEFDSNGELGTGCVLSITCNCKACKPPVSNSSAGHNSRYNPTIRGLSTNITGTPADPKTKAIRKGRLQLDSDSESKEEEKEEEKEKDIPPTTPKIANFEGPLGIFCSNCPKRTKYGILSYPTRRIQRTELASDEVDSKVRVAQFSASTLNYYDVSPLYKIISDDSEFPSPDLSDFVNLYKALPHARTEGIQLLITKRRDGEIRLALCPDFAAEYFTSMPERTYPKVRAKAQKSTCNKLKKLPASLAIIPAPYDFNAASENTDVSEGDPKHIVTFADFSPKRLWTLNEKERTFENTTFVYIKESVLDIDIPQDRRFALVPRNCWKVGNPEMFHKKQLLKLNPLLQGQSIESEIEESETSEAPVLTRNLPLSRGVTKALSSVPKELPTSLLTIATARKPVDPSRILRFSEQTPPDSSVDEEMEDELPITTFNLPVITNSDLESSSSSASFGEVIEEEKEKVEDPPNDARGTKRKVSERNHQEKLISGHKKDESEEEEGAYDPISSKQPSSKKQKLLDDLIARMTVIEESNRLAKEEVRLAKEESHLAKEESRLTKEQLLFMQEELRLAKEEISRANYKYRELEAPSVKKSTDISPSSLEDVDTQPQAFSKTTMVTSSPLRPAVSKNVKENDHSLSYDDSEILDSQPELLFSSSIMESELATQLPTSQDIERPIVNDASTFPDNTLEYLQKTLNSLAGTSISSVDRNNGTTSTSVLLLPLAPPLSSPELPQPILNDAPFKSPSRSNSSSPTQLRTPLTKRQKRVPSPSKKPTIALPSLPSLKKVNITPGHSPRTPQLNSNTSSSKSRITINMENPLVKPKRGPVLSLKYLENLTKGPK